MARSGPSGRTTTFDKEDRYDDPVKSGGAFADLDDSAPVSEDGIPKIYKDTSQRQSALSSGRSSPHSERRQRVEIDHGSFSPTASSTPKPSVDRVSQNYVPSPYTFRAPTRVKQLKRITAKCPPFYLQLDHTLAVIWTLFSDEANLPLGIAQLQWAMNFLQGIYTRKGEHPKDVALCIQAIEDLLIEKYADMVQEVTAIEEEERKKRRKKMMYLSSEMSLRSKASGCDSETCLGRLSLDVDREIVEEAELLIKQVPFSVNYSEINEKAGADADQLYSKHSKASTDASGLDFDLPQENTMEFLRQWRRDQISKIQSELKRLHSIETYIGCAETNFDPEDGKNPDEILPPDPVQSMRATRREPKKY